MPSHCNSCSCNHAGCQQAPVPLRSSQAQLQAGRQAICTRWGSAESSGVPHKVHSRRQVSRLAAHSVLLGTLMASASADAGWAAGHTAAHLGALQGQRQCLGRLITCTSRGTVSGAERCRLGSRAHRSTSPAGGPGTRVPPAGRRSAEIPGTGGGCLPAHCPCRSSS